MWIADWRAEAERYEADVLPAHAAWAELAHLRFKQGVPDLRRRLLDEQARGAPVQWLLEHARSQMQ